MISAWRPAIEVSGTPKFRGGGGVGCRLEVWWALAVCSCRLDEAKWGVKLAKVREHCGHWRRVWGVAAKLLSDTALERVRRAFVVRGSDMMGDACGGYRKE